VANLAHVYGVAARCNESRGEMHSFYAAFLRARSNDAARAPSLIVGGREARALPGPQILFAGRLDVHEHVGIAKTLLDRRLK